MHNSVLPPEGLKLPNRRCCCTFHYKRLDRSCETTFDVNDLLAAVEQKPSTLTRQSNTPTLCSSGRALQCHFGTFIRWVWRRLPESLGPRPHTNTARKLVEFVTDSVSELIFTSRALNRHLLRQQLCAFTPSYEDFKAIKHSCFCVNAELLS